LTATKRFIVLLAFGALFPAAYLFGFKFSAACFLIYDFLIILSLCADYLISPGRDAFMIKRVSAGPLKYKTKNEIIIGVTNDTRNPVFIELKDEVPQYHFNIISGDMAKTAPPGGYAEFTYAVVPGKRGAFTFKNIHMKTTGRFGLCHKYFIYGAPADMKVYPDMDDAGRYRLVLQKNRLLFAGERAVPVTGAGTEFQSLKEYVDGDDYRKINWAATARENKIVVNQYETEKNQPVYIMVDTGRSMGYSVKGYKKLDYAVNAALILSDIINIKGDNSGLIIFDTEVKTVILPGKGPEHRGAFMDALYHIEDTKNTPNYRSAFGIVAAKSRRSGVVFIFTDFETDVEADDILSAAPYIGKRHTPVIVLMENAPVVKLAETRVQNVKDAYRAGFAADYLARRERLIKKINAGGVLCVQTGAERFALESVNRYLTIRALQKI